MLARQWICTSNGVWENWDLSVVLSPWFKARITSFEVCLGSFKRLLKMRYRLVPTSIFYHVTIGGFAASFLIALYNTILARWFLTVLLALFLWCYRQALNGRREVADLAGETIAEAGYSEIAIPKTALLADMKIAGSRINPGGMSEKREAENA
jgi:hypothetical protein